jgi:hypothetical protein
MGIFWKVVFVKFAENQSALTKELVYTIGWKKKNWIKLGLIDLPKFGVGAPTPAIYNEYWETWLKLVMLENLQACFYLETIWVS